MLVSKRFQIKRHKMRGFLDRLLATEGTGSSLYLPPGLLLPEIESMLGKIIDEGIDWSEMAQTAVSSKTGSVFYWGSENKYMILPPFPISDKYIAGGYDVEPLQVLLKRDYMVALVLVRMGSFAVGIFRGNRLIASKVGTGLVHARHKKGGSSQGRFARHREKQVESFLDRVCQHVRQRMEPEIKNIDYVVYGGARTTIVLLNKRCHFLSQFNDKTLPPLLDIPDPRQHVLESGIDTVWSSVIIEWREKVF